MHNKKPVARNNSAKAAPGQAASKTAPVPQKRPAQAPAAPSMATPNSADVIMRGSWDRAQYKRSLKVAMAAILLSFGMLAFALILFLSRPEPRYFSVTNDFRVVELAPLTEPIIADAGLLNWSSDVVTRTFSMDFLHYRQQLTDVRKFYAPDAFDELISSLKSSGIVDLVKEKRLSVSVVLEKTPIITARGMVNNVMSWKVEVPILSSYESSKGVETTQHLLATILIQRADPRMYPEGIYIKQMVLK